MTDLCTELRVIAADGGRLSPADCRLIAGIADDYERTQKMLLLTQTALIEEQRARIAVVEWLFEIERERKAAARPALPQSLSSGWVRTPMMVKTWPL
jgi:hypothetical protein